MDKLKINAVVFFAILIIVGSAIIAGVYFSTGSSWAQYVRIPSFSKPLTPAQLAARQAERQKQIETCVANIKSSWGTTINLAAAENLPVSQYQKQEAQLIAKCQTNP